MAERRAERRNTEAVNDSDVMKLHESVNASAPASGWGVALATRVKVDLEEMQQRLSGDQQHALLDGINEVLKASSPQPNAEVSEGGPLASKDTTGETRDSLH